MSTTKLDVYQIVTDQIIALLEQGTVPWQKPWLSAGPPKNLISNRHYKGINVWLLAAMGYEQNLFLTFEQLKQVGGSVKRGEHGHVVVFYKTIKKEEEVAEENQPQKSHSMLKYYKVFNVSQCTEIPETMLPKLEVVEHKPIKECEAIITQMPNPPQVKFKDSEAYYHPTSDFIIMPKKKSFKSPEGFYATLFHELIHATGHASRLDRKTITDMHEFGSDAYSKEELIAELGSSYLSHSTGIFEKNSMNSVSYIESWIKKLQGDKRLIVTAASQAQRAADYVLNIQEHEPKDQVEQQEVQV